MRVRLTHNARIDLRLIHDWIAQQGDPDTALRFATDLRVKAREIGDLPLGYPAIGVRSRITYRKRSWRDYVIVYRVTHQIEIVGFFHARRDWLSLLDDR